LCFYKKSDIDLVGFTATKKIGNAVKRNRAKRLMRSLFVQNHKSLHNGSYIFLAKPLIATAKYEILKKDFMFALDGMNAVKSA
jgi:ribonuclease P protein component